MQVKEFEALARQYAFRGNVSFRSLQELVRFMRLTCDVAEAHPEQAQWVAEVASGVTALAIDVYRQDDHVEAVHQLFLDLEDEGYEPEDTQAKWRRARHLLDDVTI